MSKGKLAEVMVYVIAGVLMVIRVDWWWWGWKIEPLLGGWFSLPMLYQLCIWGAGWALVAYTVFCLWPEDYDREGSR